MPRVILALLLFAATGCEKTRDIFAITSTLESNTCGSSAMPLPEKSKYRVQLKINGDKATWKVVPRNSPISGSYQDESFLFEVAQTLDLGNPDAGTSGCTVIREETLQGTVEESDAGLEEDEPPLVGEHRIDFRADPNGTCRGAAGPLGVFERLPCEARYGLTGEPKQAR